MGLRALMGARALRTDLTQVAGLDDLHRPVGALKQAQDLAARTWGADRTWFLVNGSSCGNHAMILATVGPGDPIAVPRDAHRSVLGGLLLAGARPVYLPSRHDPELGVAGPVVAESVPPGVRAVLFTSVTPYGAVADSRALVQAAHARGAVALADEAWGPHLRFLPDGPLSAVQAGADLVVQSAHKLLPALSQSSLLHQNGARVDPDRVSDVLRLLQSTSPFFPLLAGLDLVRAQMDDEGRAVFARLASLGDHAREALARVPGLRVFRPDDPTRLVFSALDLGYEGPEVERELRRQGIQVEMADPRNVVALLTPGHGEGDVDRLAEVLRRLPRRPAKPVPAGWEPPPPARQSMSLRDAFYAPSAPVPLREAAGRTCAEWITPYPPGIPLLCPGEVFTQELVETLRRELAAGVPLEGPADPFLATVRCVVSPDSRPD